jgi:hypothetical protein
MDQRSYRLGVVSRLLVGLLVVSGSPVLASPAQNALHVLRIAAGPKGAESNGTFALTEERSVFSRSDDREIVVFFEWDGVAGPHKLVAQWRSPDGGFTSSSAIDYVAKDRRFGAFWRLTVSPSMPLGMWSIEATVDGQPGGRFTFEIKEEKVVGAIVKRPLSAADLYTRLNPNFVVIERTNTAGRQLEHGGGFLTGPARIYTAMATLDAAETLRAIRADGSRSDLASVVAWNRRQDWAVLDAPSQDGSPLPVASGDGARVGDRVFSIEGSAAGGRVLVDGNITGQRETPAGAQFLVTFLNGSGTPGAPLINEFGELIGIVGGAGVSGATRLSELIRFRGEMKGVPIIPLTGVRFRPDAPAETMAALRRRGDLVAALEGDEHVVSGGFAKDIAKGPVVAPSDQREQFSGRDKMFVAWVNWSPEQRVRGQGILRVFDGENRVVLESKPAKVDLKKGQLTLSSWQIPVPQNPGRYRVDALIDQKPIWRGFVQITQ